jgi:hypothetical protein
MMKNSNKHPLGVNSNVNCASTDRWLLLEAFFAFSLLSSHASFFHFISDLGKISLHSVLLSFCILYLANTFHMIQVW